MVHFARVQLLAFFMAMTTFAAHAEDCGSLKRAASVQLEGNYGRRVVLPVSINGTPRHFLFDTGGVFTQISARLVSELKLETRASNYRLFDASGDVSNQIAIVHDFAIGPFKGQDMQFQISSMSGADGLLTPSLFQNMDIDIDFGPGRFNLFLADHCPGKVVYWNTPVVAVVPVTLRSNHFNIPVTVDGHQLTAIIDTGATSTFMNADAARRAFGLAPDSPGMTAAGNINNDPKLASFRHGFSSLSFDGVQVTNPQIVIMPDRLGANDRDNALRTGSFIRRADDDIERPNVVIGMDVLSKLHIYFASREKNLYITPAGPSDAPSPMPAKTQ